MHGRSNACWKTQKWPESRASTINEVFRHNGLITRETSEKVTLYKRFEHKRSNTMLQADFKGHFAMENRETLLSAFHHR